jgi:hypothetical protein
MNRAIAPCHEQSKFLLAERVRRRRVAGPYNRGDHSILYFPLVLPLDLLANLIHRVHSDTDRHFRESTLRSYRYLAIYRFRTSAKGARHHLYRNIRSKRPSMNTIKGMEPSHVTSGTKRICFRQVQLCSGPRCGGRSGDFHGRCARQRRSRRALVKIRYDRPHQDCAPGRSAVSSAVERRSFRKWNRGD